MNEFYTAPKRVLYQLEDAPEDRFQIPGWARRVAIEDGTGAFFIPVLCHLSTLEAMDGLKLHKFFLLEDVEDRKHLHGYAEINWLLSIHPEAKTYAVLYSEAYPKILDLSQSESQTQKGGSPSERSSASESSQSPTQEAAQTQTPQGDDPKKL